MKKLIFSFALISNAFFIQGEDTQEKLLSAALHGTKEDLEAIFKQPDRPIGRIVEIAFFNAAQAQRSDAILKIIAQHCPSQSALLSAACLQGKDHIASLLLEEDKANSLMNSIASHNHIIEAKNAGHIAIATTVQKHLLEKGYTYVRTISLEETKNA